MAIAHVAARPVQIDSELADSCHGHDGFTGLV